MNIAVLAANKNKDNKKLDFSTLFLGFAILLLITRLFFWGTYRVDGHSMDPTLKDGDYLIAVNYFSIERGDIVTARENNKIITKRVIGLPNDTIEFKNDKLYVNGKEQEESYLKEFKILFEKDRLHDEYSYNETFQTRAAQMSHFTVNYDWKSDFAITLKDNEYYLLGDNRPVSQDSRQVGTFNRKQIIGKVIIKNINPF